MNLDTFFEKFDWFAEVPDAVANMRDLALRIAVQGKLTSDLSANGKLLSTGNDLQSRLANRGWIQAPIAKLAFTQSGGTPSRHRNEYWNGGTIPWINSGALEDCIIREPSEYITELGLANSSAKLFPRNTVVIALTGATTGRVGLLDFQCSTNQSVTGIFPSERLVPEFLFFYLRAIRSAVVAKSLGSAQPHINKGIVDALEIMVPPLAEQKRIVTKVNELMALCDQLEAEQREREAKHNALANASLARFAEAPTSANLQLLFHKSYDITPADLRKSILTLAVQGKLVSQLPADEPTDLLLRRIDMARTQLQDAGIVPKQKALAQIANDECNHTIPDTWKWIRLQRAAEIIDPNPSHRMPRYCDSGVPFISTENFVGREEIDFAIGKQVDEAELESQKNRFNIRPGSFALSRIGTIGKTRILPLKRNYCMSHALVVIAPYSNDIDSRFLRLVVSSDAVQDQASYGAKSIGVPDLGMGKIRSFVIPLPPLAEQCRIVAKVDELMALVDALEHQIATARSTAEILMEAVIAELTAVV